MRIMIDLQGAQTESRFRGIGRYSLSLALAMARNAGDHEIWLALSAAFIESIPDIRHAFDGLIPQERIRVFDVPTPVAECAPANYWRARAAENIREHFLQQLKPDVVHVSSLFEGYGDDAVTSVGAFASGVNTAVTLYDLIPLLNQKTYLPTNTQRDYYLRKVQSLKNAGLLLAISEYSRRSAIDALQLPEDHVVNISAAIDGCFRPITLSVERSHQLHSRYGLQRKMVMYAPGGFDVRKNFDGLLRAYALLPSKLRANHQLVIVSKVSDSDRASLQHLRKEAGLAEDELVLTGYLSDEDLVALYNLATLFVFPSKCEGFGMPVLEAMACGAPTIGSNTSSIHEVIGWEDALFDPLSTVNMAEKIVEGLLNERFRNQLKQRGIEHAKNFSWITSAKRAISVFEAQQPSHFINRCPLNGTTNRKELTPLLESLAEISTPPMASEGDLLSVARAIAFNTGNEIPRQLLVDISEIVQRDAKSGIQRVVRSILLELLNKAPDGYEVCPIYFDGHQYRYATNFTSQFLNKPVPVNTDEIAEFNQDDIYLALDLTAHLTHAVHPLHMRFQSIGVQIYFVVYDILFTKRPDWCSEGASILLEGWLRGISQVATGLICISESVAVEVRAWLKQNPPLRLPGPVVGSFHLGADIENSLPTKGMPDNAAGVLNLLKATPSFLTVGTVEPRKGHAQTLAAIELLWAEGIDVNWVIVGNQGWHVEDLADKMRHHTELGKRFFWLESISDEYLEELYRASACLLFASEGEGFGLPLIEAAQHKLPIIARDIPVFREVAGEHAFYFSGLEPQALADAIQQWLMLNAEGKAPLSVNMPWLTWRQSAEQLCQLLKVDSGVCRNSKQKHQLFVDISELVQRDAKSGVQRVTRSILGQLLAQPPAGFRVEPVYATVEQGYRYAHNFTSRFLDTTVSGLTDSPIEFQADDVFFGLDLQPQVVPAQQDFFKLLRRQGVRVYFLVHDLLPISLPKAFPNGTYEGYRKWLEVVVQNDGAVCVSKTTADELSAWIKNCGFPHRTEFRISWSHNGADIKNSKPTRGLPEDANAVLNLLKAKPSFLMVGTLEPRKGHTQTLIAIEQLWRQGTDVNLVIVGKQGWQLEALVKKIHKHPELNKRLFWLEGISDEYLEKVYAASICLIAASEGEGFGLPLIEAAQHKLPIIARDIPVFREVAGEHAFYFSGFEPKDLANTIKQWLTLKAAGKTPGSEGMPWLTWQESTARLVEVLVLNPEGCKR